MNLTEDKVFKLAFVISIIIHSFLILPWRMLPLKEKKVDKDSKKLNIVYRPMQFKKRLPKKKAQIKTDSLVKKGAFLKGNSQPKRKVSDNKSKPKVIKVDKEKKEAILEKNEKFASRDEQMIPLGIEQVPAKQQPAFIEYYRFIRDKIEVVAQSNRPEHFKEGKVNIIFKLNSEGKLLDMIINEEESSPDEVLRFTAMESIRRASPFPPFPEGLTAKKLEFRITIEFHI